MTRLRDLELLQVADRAEWRAWLEENSEASPGVWLAVGKKGKSRTALGYADAVEEALCFGWIDSTVRRLDEDRFKQLFTRRKAGSTWAKSNKVRVKGLMAKGLMRPPGLAAIEAAKADGSWTLLDRVDALVVPEDLAKALAADAAAQRYFDAFPGSSKKAFLYWIASAKRPATRAERIERTVHLAARDIRTPGGG